MIFILELLCQVHWKNTRNLALRQTQWSDQPRKRTCQHEHLLRTTIRNNKLTSGCRCFWKLNKANNTQFSSCCFIHLYAWVYQQKLSWHFYLAYLLHTSYVQHLSAGSGYHSDNWLYVKDSPDCPVHVATLFWPIIDSLCSQMSIYLL